MQIRDCMSGAVITIAPEESAALAARLLTRHNLGALPVCGYDGRLRGIVTDRDIVTRCVAVDQDPSRVPVADIMSRDPETVAPADDPKVAAARMSAHQVRRLPVVEEGKLVGMISLGDLARNRKLDMEAAAALSEISTNVKSRRRGSAPDPASLLHSV